MKARLAIIPLLAAAALLALPARAGTVILMNGEEIDGDVLDVGVDFVTLRVGGGRVQYPLRDVRDVEINGNSSIYEKQLKTALDRSRAEEDAKREQKRQQVLPPPPQHKAPPQIPVGAAPSFKMPNTDTSRLTGFFDGGDRYQFTVRYPAALQQGEPDTGFLTFKDPRGQLPWTFDITYFDVTDADYETVRSRAQGELERIQFYKPRSRSTVMVGVTPCERTIGFYERGSHAIRHDQLVVPTRRGVLLIHFFSPGATLDDNAVPDVDLVIQSIEPR
jgi:hypothetical protein